MGVTYITGRAATGKTHYIMNQMKERLQQNCDNSLILIVPEQFTLQAERDLIEKQNFEGLIRLEVLSFTRLAFRVFNEVGGLRKTPINDIGKSMIIKKVLEESIDDLTIYRNTSKQEGFVSKLNEMICEFKQQGITPTDLSLIIEGIQQDSMLKMKLLDMAKIYSKFNAYLEGRYVDNEDHLNLLIESIDKATFLEGAEVWIDGFHVFTQQTLKIIERLMVKAKEVYITFTMELEGKEWDKDLFHVPRNTFLRVKKIAENLRICENLVNLDIQKINKKEKSREIKHIEEEFFRYPYRRYDEKVENLKVFAGTTLYSEIEDVAIEIKRLVREKGYRYKDIAVVSGNLEGYREIIKRAFQEYDIPYFMDEKRSIMDHPIIELLLSAIESIVKNYPYKEVFRLIKTGFTDLSKDEGEILENYVLQYGIRGSKWMKDFDKGEEERLSELNSIRKKFIHPLQKLQKHIAKSKNSKEITEGLFMFLQDMNVQEKLDKWIEILKKQGKFDYVNENTQIWNTVMGIFDQIYEILGNSNISLREYHKLLASGFSACEIGVIPSTIDQVLVGSLERSRSHDIRGLFIIGVNDGVLPSLHDEEGILLDHERTVLGELGLELASGEMKFHQENFSIYSAFSKPKDYLWVSYPLADEEGKAKRPSILIDRLKKLFPRLIIEGDTIKSTDNPLKYVASPNSTFKYLVENLRLYIDNKGFHELWWDVYDWYFHQPQWLEKKDLILEGLFHENQVKYVDKVKIKDLYQTPIRTSVSRLESFVNCPFSHFINYGLRPKERKEYEIKGPDVGKILHYSIEEFARKTKENNINWIEMNQRQCEEMVEAVMQQLAENFQHGVMESTYRYQYLTKKLTRVSKKALWTLVEHMQKGDFVPYGHEVFFGEGYKIPAIVVELENGEKIYLEGRIDRIDVLEEEKDNYFKIIDYKSGDKEFNLSDVYYGLQLQLLVYLEAVMALKGPLKEKKSHPAGVFYYRIHDPMIKTSDKAVEVIQKEINKALKMKGLVVKDLKIIKAIDKVFDKNSDIIPVALNKDESIAKKSSVVTEEDFLRLIVHIKNLIKKIAKEMLKGNVMIQPCKKGKQISCQYCEYLAICQFDNHFDDNSYRVIKELKSEEVLERIRGEGEKNEGMD